MSIPPGSLVTEIDFLDPACFTNGGTSVTDLSGNSNDWTLNNTSYTYNAALGTLDLGTTSVMTGDNQTPVGTGDVPFTISVWHYATGKRDTIIYNGNYPASGLNLQTIFSSSNTKYVLAYGAGLAFTLESANTYINSWNFITFSYDGTTLKLYVNGSVVDSVATTLSQGVSGSYPNWSVNGENTGVEGFGLLNIYDAALTNGDILALYNSTKTRFLVPVSYYDPQDTASFNNTTAFNDLNGGTDFVFNSTPTYDSTYGAISFDGSNFAVLSNYLTNTWPTGTAAFTMSFWWKTAPNNPNKFAYLFFYGDGPNYIVPFSNYGTEGSVAVLDNASHAVRTTWQSVAHQGGVGHAHDRAPDVGGQRAQRSRCEHPERSLHAQPGHRQARQPQRHSGEQLLRCHRRHPGPQRQLPALLRKLHRVDDHQPGYHDHQHRRARSPAHQRR